jgi:hypothetical protein
LADALQTPAQPGTAEARRAELAARIRADLLASGVLVDRMAATVDAAPAVQALPRADRPRTWATLRDEFAATHQQPIRVA